MKLAMEPKPLKFREPPMSRETRKRQERAENIFCAVLLGIFLIAVLTVSVLAINLIPPDL